MNHEVQLHSEFGNCPCDGSKAYAFRIKEVDPYINLCERIELNFTGIRTTNSSFVNALIAGLFEQNGAALLDKMVFRGCLPTVRVLVQAAIDLGLIKHQERLAQSC